MKISKIIGSAILLLALLSSCKGTGKQGEKQNQGKQEPGKQEQQEPGKKEFAMLEKIEIGSYALTEKELKDSTETAGFSKTFEATFSSSVKIVATPKGKAIATFKKGTENITLGDTEQEIQIEASEANKEKTLYTLKLKKAQASIPALLTKIVIGEGNGAYTVQGEELNTATLGGGLSKDLKESCPSPAKVVATPADPSYNVTYNPATANTTGIPLSQDSQEVAITVAKEGMLSTTYTLRLTRGKVALAPNPFKSLVIGEGDYQEELYESEIKAATSETGLDITLKSSAPDKIKVTHVLKTFLYTANPDKPFEVDLVDNKADVTIKVTISGIEMSYKFHITKATSSESSTLKGIGIQVSQEPNSEVVKLTETQLGEAKQATGCEYVIPKDKKPGNTVIIRPEPDAGVFFKFVKNEVTNDGIVTLPTTKGNKVTVMFKVREKGKPSTVYTLKLGKDMD